MLAMGQSIDNDNDIDFSIILNGLKNEENGEKLAGRRNQSQT